MIVVMLIMFSATLSRFSGTLLFCYVQIMENKILVLVLNTIHEVKGKRTKGSSFNAVIVVFGLVCSISITVV